MKKIAIIALFAIGTGTLWAQMPVTDAAANAQLQLLLKQQMLINEQLSKLNAESSHNQISNSKSFLENEKQRILGEDGLRLSEDVENAFWIVGDYVKRGVEMNNILSLEKDIIKKLRDLRSLANSLNYKERSSILSSTNNTLNVVGGYVDTAVGIITDNQYRMSNEERRKYLQEIERNLSGVSSNLNSKLASTKSYAYYKADSEKRKKDFESAVKYQKDAKNKLAKQKQK